MQVTPSQFKPHKTATTPSTTPPQKTKYTPAYQLEFILMSDWINNNHKKLPIITKPMTALGY